MKRKKLPSPEIIAQAKSLNYYVEHLIDPSDPDVDNIIYSWYDINEKYDFYDQKFEENGHVGLKDAEGHLRVPALYRDFEEIFDFFEYRNQPASAINDEGKVALVSTDGNGCPLCPFVYDHIILIQHTPYYCTMQKGKFGLMTNRGEELLACDFDSIEEPLNGIFIISRDSKYGLFCEYGRGFVVPCIYDEISENNTFVYARIGQQWGYFDHEGHFLPKELVANPHNANLLHFMPTNWIP